MCQNQTMSDHLSRLATLVEERQDQIIDQWKVAVRKLPRAQHLTDPLLLDHMPQILDELSSTLIEAQSLSIIEMRAHKSAKEHGAIRFQLGFDVEEVIAEFGLLRDVVQQFAEAAGVNISGELNRTVNRIIDKAIASSLETYVRQQAEEVERRRQEYLSFIVHDLKTPIAALTTATSVIDQRLGAERQPSVVSKMVDIIRRNATRLNDRVMEILNEESRWQALTTDEPELQLDVREVDLWPIVERLKHDCQPIADAGRNTIRNDVPHELRIHADPDLLLDVLQNLLSNALKYTTNGEINIGGVENSDSVLCWITDTGRGIPPERLDGIFEKRTADPNVSESTGLGLAIVQKVVQLHAGTISVESAPGAGTTFRIEFPKIQGKVP
jgi:two-component system, OmpR family, phosphate regulon sensor histidine kinase PhoR